MHDLTLFELLGCFHMRKGQSIVCENRDFETLRVLTPTGEKLDKNDPLGSRIIDSVVWNDKMVIVALKEEQHEGC